MAKAPSTFRRPTPREQLVLEHFQLHGKNIEGKHKENQKGSLFVVWGRPFYELSCISFRPIKSCRWQHSRL